MSIGDIGTYSYDGYNDPSYTASSLTWTPVGATFTLTTGDLVSKAILTLTYYNGVNLQ